MEWGFALSLDRRKLLTVGLMGLSVKGERKIAGGFVNDAEAGHRLRDGSVGPRPRRKVRTGAVIVGGGISGLCCAWRLEKRGFREFVLCEMEGELGGNARWGENEISRYPWGAHYVPVPNVESELVRELMTDLGVYRGGEWDERALCFEPRERIWAHGRWSEGLRTPLRMAAKDREEMDRFDGLMAEFRSSGRFRLPSALGVEDPGLDGISMADWLRGRGLGSDSLRWYVEYGCRDDYGCLLEQVSAWAGIHYFAGRPEEEEGPLTWPEGNGWIVRQLEGRLAPYCQRGVGVERVERAGRKWRVVAGSTEWLADSVVWAAPSFVASRVVEGMEDLRGADYVPWLTANLTLERMPRDSWEFPAWDNVILRSASLGYVVANHMSLATRRLRSVWTYYLSLTDPGARKMLLERGYEEWKRYIINDLRAAHPDIGECVSRVDVMRMGHAMARYEDREQIHR